MPAKGPPEFQRLQYKKPMVATSGESIPQLCAASRTATVLRGGCLGDRNASDTFPPPPPSRPVFKGRCRAIANHACSDASDLGRLRTEQV